MSCQEIVVEAVTKQEPGRVFLQVIQPTGVDLQFIYRAALSIYWDPVETELQDRYQAESSPLASAGRIARTVREEYGMSLAPSPHLRYSGFDEATRARVAEALFPAPS